MEKEVFSQIDFAKSFFLQTAKTERKKKKKQTVEHFSSNKMDLESSFQSLD